LRDLAFADERLGRPGFREALVLAERLSRRDTGTQAARLRLAAQDGDYERALFHLDRLLTVSPTDLPNFEAAMFSLADEPAGREALARYGGRPWFSTFAQRAASSDRDPRGLAALLAAAPGLTSETRDVLAPLVLNRLLMVKDYDAAREFAARFAGAGRAALDDFRLSSDPIQHKLGPLGWEFPSSPDAVVGFEPAKGLSAEVEPGKTAVIARRSTLLAPGIYRLDQWLGPAAETNNPRLEWRVTCESGPGSPMIWRQAVPLGRARTHYRSEMAIPEPCRAQRWELVAASDEGGMAGSVNVAALSLVRA
jgi:hypothetical protein